MILEKTLESPLDCKEFKPVNPKGLDSILKSRDITLPAKVHLVKAMVFPVVMYGCESWTIKKAEHQRIDAFVFLFVCFLILTRPGRLHGNWRNTPPRNTHAPQVGSFRRFSATSASLLGQRRASSKQFSAVSARIQRSSHAPHMTRDQAQEPELMLLNSGIGEDS